MGLVWARWAALAESAGQWDRALCSIGLSWWPRTGAECLPLPAVMPPMGGACLKVSLLCNVNCDRQDRASTLHKYTSLTTLNVTMTAMAEARVATLHSVKSMQEGNSMTTCRYLGSEARLNLADLLVLTGSWGCAVYCVCACEAPAQPQQDRWGHKGAFQAVRATQGSYLRPPLP